MLTMHQNLRFYEKKWAYNELLKKVLFPLRLQQCNLSRISS